jgi:hypothetical protein
LNKVRTLKPYDFYEKNNMSFFTFDYYQTKFLLELKKLNNNYVNRISLQDSLISNQDTIIRNHKTILKLKNEQIDSCFAVNEQYQSIVKNQKTLINGYKIKVKNRNYVIISLVGILTTTIIIAN